MLNRHRARQTALEILYQIEIGDVSADEALALRQWERRRPIDDLTFRIVKGVTSKKESIDRLIAESTEHWKLERLSVIDKNILRIGIYEMLAEKDIPFSVSINEAVEIAKKYGTEDSGKFVNGVIGRIAQDLREKLKKRKTDGR